MNSRKIKEAEKNRQIEENIQNALNPLVEDGTFHDMSIREICEAIGITTGMFYRHYRSKNDILALNYIQRLTRLLEEIDEMLTGKDGKEQLVILMTEVARTYSYLGPDGILMFISNENDKCDCSIPRSMTDAKICEIIQRTKLAPPFGYTLQNICDDMTVLSKGISFEWYTKRESYNYIEETERMFRNMIDSIFD